MLHSRRIGGNAQTKCASENRLQKHVRACLEVLRTSVLDFVVAYTVLARHEDHRGGSNACNIDRIVARAADHFAVWKPQRACRGAHRVDTLRVESRRRKVVDLLQVAFKAKLAGDGGCRVAKFKVHSREMAVIGMSHVDGHLDAARNDVARVGADLHETDRGPTVGRMAHRQRVDGLDHPRSAAQRVMAGFHGCRPGVRVLSRPDAVVPAQAQCAGHYADDLVVTLENGALLDMRLEIGIERAPADGRLAGITDRIERIAKRDAVDVSLLAQVFECVYARERAGTAHHGNKPAALLVRPYGDANRVFRDDTRVVERSQHFHPAKPGDTILLFGTGFGPTNPPMPADQLFQSAAPLSDPSLLSVQIGGVAAAVQFAGLVGPGLYQLNVVVPDLPDGDQAVSASIGGSATQSNAFITTQR